jgi:very-short-patch-repair endonuclease
VSWKGWDKFIPPTSREPVKASQFRKTPVSSVPTLLSQIQMAGLPQPETEVRFHKVRRWRFDVAFVERKIAIECEGGVWVNGRHSRGAGMQKDMEKYAEAALLGWVVIRVTPKHIKSGQALAWIEGALKQGATKET